MAPLPRLSRLAPLLRRHGIGLGAVLLGTLLGAVVLTDATMDFTRPENLMSLYYDALGESLLEGRFDVPPKAIGPEAYLIDGRTYGYFGPTPAVLRLPLNALFPSMRGHWTRPMMLASAALTLLATYLLLQKARRAASRGTGRFERRPLRQYLDGFFVLCAAMGTSLVFIQHSPVIYHEALIQGVMWALWSFFWLLHYQETGAPAALFACLVCALASFQARSSVGAGPLVALGVLLLAMALQLPRARVLERQATEGPTGEAVRTPSLEPLVPGLPYRRLLRHLVSITLAAGLSVSALMYKNMKVFGSLSGAPPYHLHILLMNEPERLARTDGGHFVQPINLRTILYNYLHPLHFSFHRPFPFFFPLRENQIRLFPETRMDHLESFFSLTGINTFWCVIAVLGLVLALRPQLAQRPELARFRIALLGAAAGGGAIFMVACITQRFLHDLYPFLIVAGAVGLQGFIALCRRSRWARAGVPVLVLLALYTCYANIAASMIMGRWE